MKKVVVWWRRNRQTDAKGKRGFTATAHGKGLEMSKLLIKLKDTVGLGLGPICP